MGMFDEIAKRIALKFRTPVLFNDLKRTGPVSRSFGFDRGTPVDRHYIDGFLAGKKDLIRGRVLEVAEARYAGRFGSGAVAGIDVLHIEKKEGATITGDLASPETLPQAVADCFICTQTLHCIFDVKAAVLGAHKMLRPGGVILATLPGISQISRYDMDRWGDYWRFTSASAQKLFSPIFKGGLEIEVFGNCLSACAMLQGVAVEDLPDKKALDDVDRDYEVIIGVVARK